MGHYLPLCKIAQYAVAGRGEVLRELFWKPIAGWQYKREIREQKYKIR